MNASKPKLKNCEFCGRQFVDDTEYNKIACDTQKCRDAYCEWMHGDSEKTATCKGCGESFHPCRLGLPPHIEYCYRSGCNWKRREKKDSPQQEIKL